jgi:phage terminase large subunit
MTITKRKKRRKGNAQARKRRRWRNRPETFHDEVLGYEPWEKQLEISRSIRDHRNTAIRSNNGSGKTYHLAREALRFLMAYGPDAVVINTAPTWTQIENQFWRNLRDAYRKAKFGLGGNLLKTKLDIDETWFAIGIANDEHNMEAFQGWHAKSMLVIFDEASGISPKIYEAALGAMAGGHVVRFVLIGNPTQNSGPFYDAFKDPTFNKIHISAFDTPNVQAKAQVVPGLVTWEFVEEVRRKYGEDSDIYRVRVLGEFPQRASDTLISIDLVERAFDADRELINQDDHAIGLDPARFGDDDSAFVERKGNTGRVLEVVNGFDTMQLAGKAARYLRDNPKAILYIDVIGLGAGIFDRLREQPDIADRVRGVNVAGKPYDEAEYINIRVESWANTRDWLRDAILEKHEGFYELAQPKYKITSAGKLQLESKDEMKKRGVASPNVGDALALTLSRPTEGENIGIAWI